MPKRKGVDRQVDPNVWTELENSLLKMSVHTSLGGDNEDPIILTWRQIADQMNIASKKNQLSNNGRVYTEKNVHDHWKVMPKA
jgi:hypothetical protein